MSALTEIDTIHNAIVAYVDSEATYVSTGAGTVDVDTLLDGLVHAELLTFCSNLAEGAAGFEVGVAQDTVFLAYAMGREVDICRLSKSQLYDSCEADYGSLSKYYSESGAFKYGVLKGNLTSGTQS